MTTNRTLLARAAMASGWPVLELSRDSEVALLKARAAVESVVGPCPQAVEISPWNPDDPEEPWDLRVALPNLTPEQWLQLQTVEGVFLRPGWGPAVEEALETGALMTETLGSATLYLDEEGELDFDIKRAGVEPDDPIRALERELAVAVQEVDPRWAFSSDRGQDTLEMVVHRPTGRPGVRLSFAGTGLEGLDAEDLIATREALVRAVDGVIAARADEDVALSPQLLWSGRWGLALTAWLVATPGTGLPGDHPVPHGLGPLDRHEDLAGLLHELDVQVVGAVRDEVMEAVQALAESLGAGGGRSRWVRGADRWHFAPTWRWSAEHDPTPFVEGLGEITGVGAIRVVPGLPVGLEDRYGLLSPSVHVHEQAWVVRWRAVRDRDLVERIFERELDYDDRALLVELKRTLSAVDATVRRRQTGEIAQGVADSAGREGLEIRLGPDTVDERRYRQVMDAIADALPVHWAPLITCGFVPGNQLSIRLWRVADVAAPRDFRTP